MKKRQGQKGFTLIELMIVVAIIGVLSAIAIPAYKDYVSKSQAASGLATLKSLVTPAELIIQDNGELSGAITTLNISEDANKLGKLSISGATSIVFTFGADAGKLKTKTISMNRNASTGWSCSTTVTDGVEGCSK
ncbi:pilin [Aliivibrio fischeri]|uniref:pilin n=1 Tax=Aliivibrio fischeri TaxID=668 RepID=UPI0006CF563A|nr:pilin [Aliivibrio fischeri]MUK65932.1 prepilin-type N-terminal cleavage/methylation domain-containing protein [Aliivibrio fischeri]OCH41668.1 pilus assembly protein PilA [Aliivibrio fischeri]USR95125.1 pilin [Aliivibrio fischeri ATCC 7744 = JCM 18803 = DSM 507]GGK35619.1 pilus assembly protein PilA [Aliivibrio fischeri]